MNTPPYLPDFLTAEQRDAILHTGAPLLIIAGPGSGKTEILTWCRPGASRRMDCS